MSADGIDYIIVKTDRVAEVIAKWFNDAECCNPIEGNYEDCIGTWKYSERFDEWFKLEREIEKLQALLNEVNR